MEKTNGQAGEPIQLDTPPPVDAASAQAAAIKQVDEFVAQTIAPIRERYTGKLAAKVQLKV